MMFTEGSIIFQPLSIDPQSALIAFDGLLHLRRPRFSHCGVYVGGGKMITASFAKVELQDAGATGSVAVPYAWQDWNVTKTWLQAQIGLPYDWAAWLLAVIPLLKSDTTGKAFTCSSLVYQALANNRLGTTTSRVWREVSPDDVARLVGAI